MLVQNLFINLLFPQPSKDGLIHLVLKVVFTPGRKHYMLSLSPAMAI
jgi:hypothetical protein